MKRHQQYKHTFQKFIECINCDIKFVDKGNLTRHQRRIHTFEKPFTCFLCVKKFDGKHVRKIHSQTHTGVFQYLLRVKTVLYILFSYFTF